MVVLTYQDRSEAGQVLARALQHYRGAPNTLVLALPRGGVPVAYEVTHALGIPLDVFVVRKIGHPQQREYAIGALSSGGALVLEPHAGQVPRPALDDVVRQETLELAQQTGVVPVALAAGARARMVEEAHVCAPSVCCSARCR